MSIKYMNRVWEVEDLKGGRLLLMLAIADHANDAGEAWPHQKTLAQKSRLDARQVRRLEDTLIADDYLAIEEKMVDRRKRRVYMLFPSTEDKMSADIFTSSVADKMSAPAKEADISDTTSGHFLQGGADISDTIYSHAGSESPIEPPIEPKEDDDDTHVRDAIHQSWFDHYGEELPSNLDIPVTGLIAETSEAAVLYGIKASHEAKARTFRYIAQCARNYIPPAASNGHSYHVDIPGAAGMATTPKAAPKLPPPMAHDDVWTIALAELRATLPGVAASYLANSQMVAAGAVNGIPLYRIVLEERAAVGIGWLVAQAGPAIRRKLSVLMGKSVLVEIVSAERELA